MSTREDPQAERLCGAKKQNPELARKQQSRKRAETGATCFTSCTSGAPMDSHPGTAHSIKPGRLDLVRSGPIAELARSAELQPFDGPKNFDPAVRVLLICLSQSASDGLIETIARNLGRSIQNSCAIEGSKFCRSVRSGLGSGRLGLTECAVSDAWDKESNPKRNERQDNDCFTCCTSRPRAQTSVVMSTRVEPPRNSFMIASRSFWGMSPCMLDTVKLLLRIFSVSQST